MNRALVGFFLLPLAFAALPLIAIVVTANASTSPAGPRVEVLDQQETTSDSGFEVTTLGFTEEENLASNCSSTDSQDLLFGNES